MIICVHEHHIWQNEKQRMHIAKQLALINQQTQIHWQYSELISHLIQPYTKRWYFIDSGAIIVYMMMLIPPDTTAELLNISILPQYQHMKLGSQLLTSGLLWLTKQGYSHLILEVRESNTLAQQFYQKFGFQMIHRRKRYYKHPIEDALIFSLSL